MSEFYPVQADSSALEYWATQAAIEHWKAHNSNPTHGDVRIWNVVVTNAIVELGIPRDRAISINEVAKLEAQFNS